LVFFPLRAPFVLVTPLAVARLLLRGVAGGFPLAWYPLTFVFAPLLLRHIDLQVLFQMHGEIAASKCCKLYATNRRFLELSGGLGPTQVTV